LSPEEDEGLSERRGPWRREKGKRRKATWVSVATLALLIFIGATAVSLMVSLNSWGLIALLSLSGSAFGRRRDCSWIRGSGAENEMGTAS